MRRRFYSAKWFDSFGYWDVILAMPRAAHPVGLL